MIHGNIVSIRTVKKSQVEFQDLARYPNNAPHHKKSNEDRTKKVIHRKETEET